MLFTPGGDLLTWNFTFYAKLNLISDRIIWNVKLPTSALQFSRTSARNRETHGIENAARRSPITIASEIYRFIVADNSILFLSSSFPVPFFPESIDLYVDVGSEMYRALQLRASPRVVTPSAMRTRCSRNIVRLVADFGTAWQRN